ncbi:MAG: DEAD/DEAH box helicase [Candidatus Eremiobacteraeota bacterium]|nr:DEAD/DEAH box helicase [Candidatus Eremiobacteraeota bacterium]
MKKSLSIWTNLKQPTSRHRISPSKKLPPPTPSEAAFEAVLASFDAPDPAKAEPHVETTDEFIERLFRDKATFLERDPFATIGEANAFYTKVVGVSFEGRQDLVAGLQEGFDLTFERQASNPHDANAIAVRYGALQVGFIKRQIAKHLAPAIDSGARYTARIGSITGGGTRNWGVNIYVQRQAGLSATETAKRLAGADANALARALIGENDVRNAQREVLARLEAGKNTLAVMGTGRGKSFCFQYPAAQRALHDSQKTLVIYPLRALANDQFEAMRRRLEGFGLRIHRANGSINADERADLFSVLESGDWDIVLATPEFLHFHLHRFTATSVPSFVVIDEAHHLFESKHRPAYGKLAPALTALGNPQVLALTATAADDAFKHITRALKIDSWVIDPTVRENLHIVDAREERNKLSYVRNVLEEGGKGILYCNSRSEAVNIAEKLRVVLGNVVAYYHAGLASPERAVVENIFRESSLRVIVATSAFGEGIDLPDVRNVILYHLNFSFTEFNQQAGRAGRDGAPAHIHLLFGERDRRLNDYIIAKNAPSLSMLRELYKGIRGLSLGRTLRMTHTDIARTLDFDMADGATVGVALRIFEDADLVRSGVDDDGRFITFLDVREKIDLTKNERFAEGEAEHESFERFCSLVLGANVQSLESIINRPIFPQGVELLR